MASVYCIQLHLQIRFEIVQYFSQKFVSQYKLRLFCFLFEISVNFEYLTDKIMIFIILFTFSPVVEFGILFVVIFG